jgi:hypothetical protein
MLFSTSPATATDWSTRSAHLSKNAHLRPPLIIYGVGLRIYCLGSDYVKTVCYKVASGSKGARTDDMISSEDHNDRRLRGRW